MNKVLELPRARSPWLARIAKLLFFPLMYVTLFGFMVFLTLLYKEFGIPAPFSALAAGLTVLWAMWPRQSDLDD